ncbi:MAG: hypothetical protein IPO21_19880 [Bacteroidales bacterium]|nr:hypothetical protein [Bacteroidales bacterium]
MMKRNLFLHLFILVFVVIFCNVTVAQNFSQEIKDSQSKVKKMLDASEDSRLSEAANVFEEANFIMESVDEQDVTLEKSFANGSNPKAEKKAVNVKVQRIDASKQYENAYNILYEVYDAKLSKLKWNFPEDKAVYKEKIQFAADNIVKAAANADNYKYLEAKDLTTFIYSDLKSSIETTMSLYVEAISLQMECFELYFEQDEKKLSMGDDDFAWSIANAENKYKSFKSYYDKFPTGAHIDEAKIKMFELDPDLYQTDVVGSVTTSSETTKNSGTVSNSVLVGYASTPEVTETATVGSENQSKSEAIENATVAEVENVVEEKQPETQAKTQTQTQTYSTSNNESTNTVAASPNNSGVVYSIQILAIERGKLTEDRKRSFYNGSEPLNERFEDGMYKYTIGAYNSFSQAKQAMSSIGMDAFIVTFKDGIRIR